MVLIVFVAGVAIQPTQRSTVLQNHFWSGLRLDRGQPTGRHDRLALPRLRPSLSLTGLWNPHRRWCATFANSQPSQLPSVGEHFLKITATCPASRFSMPRRSCRESSDFVFVPEACKQASFVRVSQVPNATGRTAPVLAQTTPSQRSHRRLWSKSASLCQRTCASDANAGNKILHLGTLAKRPSRDAVR